MARRPRVEIEGGLYHVITRGNDRQDIFHSREDQQKFISLLEKAKHRLGFYVYAYCLMTNHSFADRAAFRDGRTHHAASADRLQSVL